MKIINIPIEPIEERYSLQWDKWFKDQFTKAGLDFSTVYGEKTRGKILHGSFLDVLETNLYKTSQLRRIIRILMDYKDDYPLVLFFHDLWNPGLTNIAYIRDGMGWKNLFIVGCLHAGAYDENDFLYLSQMNPWAQLMECAWFEKIVDKIFVATNYHKELVQSKRWLSPEKVCVTGFPMYPDFLNHYKITRKDIIVFPHRLYKEKRPDLFDRLKIVEGELFLNWEFYRTKDVTKTKSEYYDLLGRSKVAVSFAEQETWGIAMQEATLLGCIPIVPRRLSYPELYNDVFIYTDFKEAKSLIRRFMNDPPLRSLEEQQSKILRRGREAIPNMIKLIKILTHEQSI